MLLSRANSPLAIMTLAALLLVCFPASGQDVPPPPKPRDDGPSLEDTMKFVQVRLNGQGRVNFVVTEHEVNEVDRHPDKDSYTITETDADPKACSLSFRTVYVSPDVFEDARTVFSFREVEKLSTLSMADRDTKANAEHGQPDWKVEYVPSVFSLTVQMQEGKSVRENVHIENRGKVPTSGERNPTSVSLIIRDEEMLQRIAKAMVHAVELCGGGSKDPF